MQANDEFMEALKQDIDDEQEKQTFSSDLSWIHFD
jgi:hypothetical protein